MQSLSSATSSLCSGAEHSTVEGVFSVSGLICKKSTSATVLDVLGKMGLAERRLLQVLW